ncbi:MAG TPA: L-glutamate gamma-semialdehyde dehydrogenase [Chitinophagales bacterium]|nr:L-glutamate gamma-semialdehyde dehydrogenase [Chitinophagales bacterium]HMW12373.1 L-glutamate gamma-semialdehyde dehydrogenase [Chitinophagales bacterium]HMY24423.1 L-glutamate gamma-semialdehyde dehydrogenase [Chitinophagales bacterium]HMZ32481.1 L-glutamate gamma-semialdehyde dehydrogenase [Chitinophagales bacterium]HNB48994.1 L-glutamate gamma-semialdehyde dehydrogenase [Chitinophagales bacterium]
MPNKIATIPLPTNEPILAYLPNSTERINLKKEISRRKNIVYDIPMIIAGKEVRTNDTVDIFPPHELSHKLAHYHKGNTTHVQQAIDAALQAREKWASMHWEDRASIFLKAADLIAGPYRAAINAATMLGQSKNVYQAEIDSACELADFLRFNVYFASQIYNEQPISSPGTRNTLEYRPLEGFVYAVTPFNFTAIAGNLSVSPALMGNVVVWKPSNTQIYSAWTIMEIFKEAGLPDGVINMVFANAAETTNLILSHPFFAGVHFTGSTGVFNSIWETIGKNLHIYKSYPRIVGETGGKDYILAHQSADIDVLATALLRGAFEYQGQKCSACSRAYIPKSIWDTTWEKMYAALKTFKIGNVENFTVIMGAVISEDAFKRITRYIEQAKANPDNIIMYGGNYDNKKGYYIEPTVILTKDPKSATMVEEIFGPVLTIYVYEDETFDDILHLVDNTSEYALTGAVLAQDTYIIEKMRNRLVNSAGNFYINDKCTGAVVGQQPFGGARKSGTNDKAGSKWNLLRWVSPRTIKENYVPPKYYSYPYMDEE